MKDSRMRPAAVRRVSLFMVFCALGMGVLSGCGTNAYVDSRREAGQTTPVGTSTPDRVAICYSSRATDRNALMQMAETECAKTGRTARFDGQDDFSCVLLAPTRAFFKCVPKA